MTTAPTTLDPVDDPAPEAAIALRVEIYKRIEACRERPLIVYATSTRANVTMHMAGDAVREFIDQVDAIDSGEAVDVLLHSHGGDGLAAWKLMSVLRERFKRVGVLVPYAAFSAATIFALGADEIVLHPNASLGPIDPQITALSPDGKRREFAYEDLGAFLRFLEEEVGITEQAHFATVIDRLFSAVDPLGVGAARRASDLSSEVGARMLRLHTDDPRACEQIAQNLNKSFFAHGDAVSRTRAQELELKIAKSDTALERLMWEAYEHLEILMQFRKPFNPVGIVLQDAAAAALLVPAAPLTLPSNTPPQIALQVWQQAADAALRASQAAAPAVPYRIVGGVIESRRLAAAFEQRGALTGIRLPDGNIQVVRTDRSTGWRSVPLVGTGSES